MKMRSYELALLPFLLVAAGCAQESDPATAMAVTVQTDFQRGTELTSVEYRTFAIEANPQVDQPVGSTRVTSDQLDRPYVISKNEDQEVLIAVQGFGATNEPIVEYRVRARFEPGKTVEVPVFLGKACRGKTCADPAQVCHGLPAYNVKVGECGAVPALSGLPGVTEPVGRATWDASYDAGAECTIAPDAGICDAVNQCGCPAGQACRTDDDQPLCVSMKESLLPRDAKCEAALDCEAGLSCFLGYCGKICRSSADCGAGGTCYTDGHLYGTCLKPCQNASECATGVDCYPFGGTDGVPKANYCANAPKEFICSGNNPGNGVCDERVNGGTGRCEERGSDAYDCTCDVPSGQTHCAMNETCRPVLEDDGWYAVCERAGAVKMGGACVNRDNCERGTCIEGTCTEYCDFTTRTGCPTGKVCEQLNIGETTIRELGVCS